MTAQVIDLTREAAKRDAKKFRFTPKSETEFREAEGRSELLIWFEKYKDLGSHFMADQGAGLLMMADMMKLER
jgi:hypothetical protein